MTNIAKTTNDAYSTRKCSGVNTSGTNVSFSLLGRPIQLGIVAAVTKKKGAKWQEVKIGHGGLSYRLEETGVSSATQSDKSLGNTDGATFGAWTALTRYHLEYRTGHKSTRQKYPHV
mmetsp:Transcript_6387/g.12458  ORF Transcript_6387/g.12458 Transcript_6387/m.12458 type:complete len:117 (+) Transcript_6387:1211-1561(+)